VGDAPADHHRIRLATYNIHSHLGRDGKCDPGRIAKVIKELSADVVALQEVTSRHGKLEALEFLAAETGMTAVSGPTMHRPDTGGYGNAVLTRGHVMEVQRIDLSFGRHEPRGAIDVMLEIGGQRLRVIATHLGLRPAERRHQIEILLARHEPDDSCPVALMGDINEWFLWGRPLRQLHARFGEPPAPSTFPSGWPVFALDRIWVSPLERLGGLAVHASALARVASDHLPLVAVIEACRKD
jgi:endonuclease/exonuclease/phosphatase family metal-dependent hydrolase